MFSSSLLSDCRVCISIGLCDVLLIVWWNVWLWWVCLWGLIGWVFLWLVSIFL